MTRALAILESHYGTSPRRLATHDPRVQASHSPRPQMERRGDTATRAMYDGLVGWVGVAITAQKASQPLLARAPAARPMTAYERAAQQAGAHVRGVLVDTRT